MSIVIVTPKFSGWCNVPFSKSISNPSFWIYFRISSNRSQTRHSEFISESHPANSSKPWEPETSSGWRCVPVYKSI